MPIKICDMEGEGKKKDLPDAFDDLSENFFDNYWLIGVYMYTMCM